MSTTQAITSRQQIANLRTMLDGMKDQIQAALPRHLTPERMVRVVMTAIQRTPKLMECSPGSIMGSVITASQLGIEPDGVLGRGYLIPRKNRKTNQMEANFMPGYLGLIDLAQRSGKVSWVAAELVFNCDKFEIVFGLDRKLIHIPDFDNQDRGVFDDKRKDLVGLRGAYAIVRYKDGETDFEYMPKAKLDRLRNFSQSKDSDFSPWNTPLGIEDMYRKCPIRKLAKRCPLSPEFQKATQLEELAEAGLPQDLHFELDPASEAARLATVDKTNALVGKYAKTEESQEPAAHPEDESQEYTPTMEEALATAEACKAEAQREANETGKAVQFKFLGMTVTIDPEPSPNPQQTPVEQTNAQPQASSSEHGTAESQHSPKSGRSRQPARSDQGALLDSDKR
jgi:recombination protein RecT